MSVLLKLQSNRYGFWCPGCEMVHIVRTKSNIGWQFNNDIEKPTFHPSILTSGVKPLTDDEHERIMKNESVPVRHFYCHSFVENGKIKYLSDSEHNLRDKTIDMEPVVEDDLFYPLNHVNHLERQDHV